MHTAHTTTGSRSDRRNSDIQPLLLSVGQAARLLGVGTTLCWEMVHSGQLPSIRLGRRVLVPRAALEQLVGVPQVQDDRHA